jgi:MFS family permease
MVSKLFLVGFASTGIFGPWMGRFIDGYGRKLGTILFTVLYTLGALSTRSSLLLILLLGRVAGGIGTSLLFSAPEAWLVAEFQKLVLFYFRFISFYFIEILIV